jgi:hypothetical protein
MARAERHLCHLHHAQQANGHRGAAWKGECDGALGCARGGVCWSDVQPACGDDESGVDSATDSARTTRESRGDESADGWDMHHGAWSGRHSWGAEEDEEDEERGWWARHKGWRAKWWQRGVWRDSGACDGGGWREEEEEEDDEAARAVLRGRHQSLHQSTSNDGVGGWCGRSVGRAVTQTVGRKLQGTGRVAAPTVFGGKARDVEADGVRTLSNGDRSAQQSCARARTEGGHRQGGASAGVACAPAATCGATEPPAEKKKRSGRRSARDEAFFPALRLSWTED